MNKSISPQITALTFSVLVVLFAVGFYIFAWTEPSQAPPGGNVAPPLNTSNVAQIKEGGLVLNTGGAPNGLVVDKGNLCLGIDCRNSWGTGIPSGMIAMFDTSCPSGWTRFSALDDRFPQGSVTYGGTGGASSHSHSVSGTTGDGSNQTGSIFGQSGGPAFSSPSHTHTYSANTNSASNLPPYLNVIWCKKN